MGIFLFEIEQKKTKTNKHFILLPDNDGTDEYTSPSNPLRTIIFKIR